MELINYNISWGRPTFKGALRGIRQDAKLDRKCRAFPSVKLKGVSYNDKL